MKNEDPHSPELKRLLDKIAKGQPLTDAELMFAADWLEEISAGNAAVGKKTTAAAILAILSVRGKYKEATAP